ncbi:MAG: hypothetical protein PWQ19_630 [Tepidiphilus sp.]|nr:hypothetical protein [Tepidiphilus sp.]
MAQILSIHPVDPQKRLVDLVARQLRQGAVVAMPTDSSYALTCHLGDVEAIRRIRRIRDMDESQPFTLLCRDLSELGNYARVDNRVFRLLKANTPGPYVFILEGTHDLPRRILHPKRRTIGLRVPQHRVVQAILEALGEPLLSTSLILPGEEDPLPDAEAVSERIGKLIDVIVDTGETCRELTTVVDLTGETPRIVRVGAGDPTPFLVE